MCIILGVFSGTRECLRIILLSSYYTREPRSAQPFYGDHTVRGALSPPGQTLTWHKGAGLSNSGPCPSARLECCARQHPDPGAQDKDATSANHSGRGARVAAIKMPQGHPARTRMQSCVAIVISQQWI